MGYSRIVLFLLALTVGAAGGAVGVAAVLLRNGGHDATDVFGAVVQVPVAFGTIGAAWAAVLALRTANRQAQVAQEALDHERGAWRPQLRVTSSLGISPIGSGEHLSASVVNVGRTATRLGSVLLELEDGRTFFHTSMWGLRGHPMDHRLQPGEDWNDLCDLALLRASLPTEVGPGPWVVKVIARDGLGEIHRSEAFEVGVSSALS